MRVPQDTASDIARHIVKTRIDDIPARVIDACKAFVLDSIGCAMAGTNSPGIAEILGVTGHWGGRPESTVFGFGDQLPAPEAALINGAMIHSRDFDDTHDVAIVHANASVLPATVATAEARGGVSGKELLAAITLGIDLACRLGLSLKLYKGWHNSAICGGFGAAAAASRILGLGEQQTANALGVAYAQTAGNIQCIRDGVLTKRMQLGFAARMGVVSAYFARAGVTGTKNTFDGPYGFLRLYDGKPSGDPEEIRHRPDGEYGAHELLSELGTRFESANLSMKPYPNSRAVHPAIAGVIDLCKEHGVVPGDVKAVVIFVSERTLERVGSPFVVSDAALQVKAQFNIFYGVAVAICKGHVALRDFEEENIRDAQVLAMIERIALKKEPAFHENLPLRIEIETKSGSRHVKLVETLLGAPDDPLNAEQVEAKFRGCCASAKNPPSSERMSDIIHVVSTLDDLDDIRHMTRLLG